MNGTERHARDLFGDGLRARDGELGRVRDLYFDDRRWTVRYLVIDTRRWVSGGRRALVPPASVLGADAQRHRLEVDLTCAQILGSPDVDTSRPVSRQHEVAIHEHYDIPFYWAHDAVLERATGDPHLRSVHDVRGYVVRAGDAPLGHVADFVVDTRSWTITGVVVTAHRWLRGERLIVRIDAVHQLSGLARSVYVDREARGARDVKTA
jgi:PRC-barrel domain